MFKNCQDAGKILLESLYSYKDCMNGVIVVLARGGLVIASEIAKGLRLPFEIFVPEKLDCV